MKKIGIVVCLASVLGSSAFHMSAPASAAQLENAAAGQAQRAVVPQSKALAPTASAEQDVHCDVEAKCLTQLRGIASRSGKNLKLKLDNGSTKSFSSTESCEIAGESCVHTLLADFRPSQHLFVLSAQYYESPGSIIVSRRTGEIFRIEAAAPHFSPDGKRFAVVAVSEQDGINQLAIYNTSAFPPVLEWSQRPKSWYGFVGWTGNDQVKLRALDQNSEASVSHTSSGWKLAPPDG